MDPEFCIRVEELRVFYRKNRTNAVDGIDLSIPKASIHGVLGPNGAGKTTLISVLCGVMRPGSGSVHVLDHPLPAEREALKSRIGVIPQEIALYPSLTVRENLLYIGRMQGMSSGPLRERVEKEIRNFELEPKRNERVDRLSGGMKRRVNLMAGILHHPELLFLDEPTPGIDIHSRMMILDRLRKMREEGVSMLYSSHDMGEAADLCDRMSVMDRGRIVEESSSEEIAEMGSGGKGLRELLLRVTDPKEDQS